MPESGWLMLKGLAAEVTFYKGLFDKLGVKADWMQVGEFKSFGEPYTRTIHEPGLPRGDRFALLGDNYDMMAEAIAKRQGISLQDAKALIDGGPYSPSTAKADGPDQPDRLRRPDRGRGRQVDRRSPRSSSTPSTARRPRPST